MVYDFFSRPTVDLLDVFRMVPEDMMVDLCNERGKSTSNELVRDPIDLRLAEAFTFEWVGSIRMTGELKLHGPGDLIDSIVNIRESSG